MRSQRVCLRFRVFEFGKIHLTYAVRGSGGEGIFHPKTEAAPVALDVAI
jgi:hypothetical protein